MVIVVMLSNYYMYHNCLLLLMPFFYVDLQEHLMGKTMPACLYPFFTLIKDTHYRVLGILSYDDENNMAMIM
jgi:hypothetical protein